MKKILKYICITLTLSSLMSCNDWLSVEPDDDVIRERFWTTKEDVHSALMGCYASMMQNESMSRYLIWGEMRADMVEPGTKAGTNEVSLQDGEISPNNKYCIWRSIYTTINNCNTVLEYAPQVQKKDQSFSEKLLFQYQAEAICIRSLMYFYLTRTFGDVPYITTASLNDQQDYAVAKSAKEDILKQLIIDLEQLKKNEEIDKNQSMVDEFGTDKAVNKGRFTRYGMKALLADMYLWNEDYTNCISTCNEIINSGKYKLVPVSRTKEEYPGSSSGQMITVYHASEGDADALFESMYVKGNSVESIFELQFAEDYETPLNLFFHPSYFLLGAKVENLYDTFFISSALDREWDDVRGNGVSYKQGFVWKWIGLGRSSFTPRMMNESFSNWIFYRLADVYLMKAEALTQTGIKNDDQAMLKESLGIVTLIRERANATETTQLLASEASPIDGKTLEEFILLERGREFAFEGKRWFDVLRHAKRDKYAGNNIEYLMSLAIYAANPTKVTSLQNKWRSSHDSHYLPISQSDLETNTRLVQNPFYAN